MRNPFTLEGKTILVTGASSGIGRSIAIACARMGAKVILTARNKERLQDSLFQMEGEGHLIFPADLTDNTQRKALAAHVPELDGVVHCAGIGSRVLCKMLEQNDVQYVMDINFNAPVLLQAALMQEKKITSSSSIVFVASAAATMPSIGNAVYSASKAALISYAKCLSLELAVRKIRVNCISPTMVWTDLALVGATEEQLREAEQAYPLHRYAMPDDIAPMATYLLSDEAAWITGSNYELTGGALIL